MKIEVKDFVLIKDETINKPLLTEVLKISKSGERFKGVISLERRAVYGDDSFKVEFSDSDVVANLGPSPNFGKVYNSDVEPYFRSIKHPLFKIPMAVMVDLSPKEEETIKKAVSKLGKTAKKFGFLSYIRNIKISIKPGLNKVAGLWMVNKDEGEKIVLFVPRMTSQFQHFGLPYDYVFFHEIGHHFWNMYMVDEEKARWVTLYRKALEVEEVSSTSVLRHRAGLEEAGSIKGYKKELDEANKKEFSEILKNSVKTFSVRPTEIDALLAAKQGLSKFWITNPVQLSQSDFLITEYARKNSQELFCECVAHLFAEMEMPERLLKITTNQVRKLVKRGPHGEVRSIKVSG